MSTCIGQDTSAFFVLSAEDIRYNNIQNLEEALDLLPTFHQYHSDNQSHTTGGSIKNEYIAIFKNDLPYLLDQNTPYDLRGIPVWDLSRIELRIAPSTYSAKNAGTMAIFLYTADYQNKPISAQASLTNSSANDFHINSSIELSNLIHTARIGINRSFSAAQYEQLTDRGTAISSYERYDLNASYSYKILKSVGLTVALDNSFYKSVQRGEVIEGTARVRDVNQSFARNRILGSLETALSKNHTLILSTMWHRAKNNLNTLDKDLSNGSSQSHTGLDAQASSNFAQSYMQLLLTSENRKLNYTMGLELSSIKDNEYPTINAIQSTYSDYTAFGSFSYQLQKTFKLEGGAKLLTNSLANSYLLPHAKVTLAPKNDLQLVASYQKSIAYSAFSNLFYTPILNGGMQSNILLKPIDVSTVSVRLLVSKKSVDIHSGILYNNVRGIPRPITNDKVQNAGSSTGNTTYAGLTFKNDWIKLRPSVMLHGTNQLKDTANLTYFTPEANLYVHIKIPNTKLAVSATGRYIGKHSTLALENDVITIYQQGKMRYINLAASHTFAKDRMNLVFGITNANNQTFVSNQRFILQDIEPLLTSETSVAAARDRAFFFNVSYVIK